MPRRVAVGELGMVSGLEVVREEAKRYLVVTDGTLTEKTYFETINKLARDVIIVKKVRHTSDLVDVAITMRDNGNFDEVFIVCDIDEHCSNARNRAAFEGLVARAKDEGMIMLCSHECFEVWLLAHKQQVSSNAKDRKVAQHLTERAGLLVGKNAKLVVAKEITVEVVKKASLEAKRLRRTYGGNVLEDGPTTDVDKMVDLVVWNS